ncbi:unnamed protein product [Closterium sp. NIES-53]
MPPPIRTRGDSSSLHVNPWERPEIWWVNNLPRTNKPYGIYDDYGIGKEALEVCSALDGKELDPNIGRTNIESAGTTAPMTTRTTLMQPHWNKDEKLILMQERYELHLKGEWSGMQGMQGQNQFAKLHRNLLGRNPRWSYPVSHLCPKLQRMEAAWLRWRGVWTRSGEGLPEGCPLWYEMADQLWRDRETVRPTTTVESGPVEPTVNSPADTSVPADTPMTETPDAAPVTPLVGNEVIAQAEHGPTTPIEPSRSGLPGGTVSATATGSTARPGPLLVHSAPPAMQSTPTATMSAPARCASPSPSKSSSSTPTTKRPRGLPHPHKAATSLNIGPGGALCSGRTTVRARSTSAMEDERDEYEDWAAMSKSGQKGKRAWVEDVCRIMTRELTAYVETTMTRIFERTREEDGRAPDDQDATRHKGKRKSDSGNEQA